MPQEFERRVFQGQIYLNFLGLIDEHVYLHSQSYLHQNSVILVQFQGYFHPSCEESVAKVIDLQD